MWSKAHSRVFCKFGLIVDVVDSILLYKKLTSLPDHLKSEVDDFIDFLLAKAKGKEKKPKPKYGSARGMFVMKPDFDEPLEDFKDYTS